MWVLPHLWRKLESIGIEMHKGSCELKADTMNAHLLNKKQSEDNGSYETNPAFVFNRPELIFSSFVNKDIL